jgi:hypothetical protein
MCTRAKSNLRNNNNDDVVCLKKDPQYPTSCCCELYHTLTCLLPTKAVVKDNSSVVSSHPYPTKQLLLQAQHNIMIMWGSRRMSFYTLVAIQLSLLVTVLQFDSIAALTNMSSRVKHVVMFTLQDDVSDEKVEGT